MRRTTTFGIVTGFLTLAAILLGPEVALRLHHGELLTSESLLPRFEARTAKPRADYDPQVGWVPAKGSFRGSPREAWLVDETGLRSNGSAVVSSAERTASASLLALGDSFTFGDEVLDHETWPAQLETLTGRQVLNAGVFAYGVDQAFLRARLLLARYSPDFVLLAFISDNINRTEFSYYWGWKPYSSLSDGELELRNVPVPRGGAPRPPLPRLRAVLGYSFFARAVTTRLAPRWWHHGAMEIAHSDGDAVTVELLRRLDRLARDRGAALVAIALGTSPRLGGNSRLAGVVEQVRGHGIDVLDLAPEVSNLIASGRENLFLERGHYSASMNGWVAARVADHIGLPRVPGADAGGTPQEARSD